MGLLIRNGTVVSAEGQRRADVLVEGERIVEVGAVLPAGGHTVVDATGLLVMPGGRGCAYAPGYAVRGDGLGGRLPDGDDCGGGGVGRRR